MAAAGLKLAGIVRERLRSRGWLPLLLFIALAVAATWPLARDMRTRIASDLGDPVLNCWILMWTGGQVLRFLSGDLAAIGDYWNGNIFYPERLTVAYSEHLAPQLAQILPIFAITHNIVLCYNLLFLSAIVLSGYGMYLFVREITGHPIAAFVAGVAFAFSPYRSDQYTHLQVISSQWMPFALLALHRYAATGRPRALAGAAAATVAQALSCGYYIFFFLPVAAAYGMWELVTHGRWRERRVWAHLGIAVVVSLAVMTPFLRPYTEVRRSMGIGVRPIQEIQAFSADTWSFTTASENLYLWGESLRAFAKPEGAGFLGVTIMALGAIGVTVAATRAMRAARQGRGAPLWRRLAAAIFVLAGLALAAGWIWLVVWQGGMMRGETWRITVRHVGDISWWSLAVFALAVAVFPGFRRFLGAFAASPGGVFAIGFAACAACALGPVVMVHGKAIGSGPYLLLYKLIPGFDGMRVPSRFLMIATLFLSALCGIGVAAVWPRRRAIAAGLAAAAVVAIVSESLVHPFIMNKQLSAAHFDLQPGTLLTPANWGAVYDAVEHLPASAVLAEFPFGAPPFDMLSMYYAGFHRRRLLNGFSGFFPPSYAREVAVLKEEVPDREAGWRMLIDAGVTHVIVHEGVYFEDQGASLSQSLRAFGARELAAAGGDRLFAIR